MFWSLFMLLLKMHLDSPSIVTIHTCFELRRRGQWCRHDELFGNIYLLYVLYHVYLLVALCYWRVYMEHSTVTWRGRGIYWFCSDLLQQGWGGVEWCRYVTLIKTSQNAFLWNNHILNLLKIHSKWYSVFLLSTE